MLIVVFLLRIVSMRLFNQAEMLSLVLIGLLFISLQNVVAEPLEHSYKLSTKTTYQSAITEFYEHSFHKNNHKHHFDSENGQIIRSENSPPEKCEVVQLNGFIRHGIRNPGKKDIDKFLKFLNKIESSQSDFIDKHYELYLAMVQLRDVVLSIEQKMLLPEGFTEQENLARDIFNHFLDFLKNIHSDDVHVTVSTVQRTSDSATAFLRQWRQELNDVTFDPLFSVNDTLMRFFDECDKYVKLVDNDPHNAMREYHKYMDEQFPSISKRVSAEYNIDMTQKLVKVMYVMAAIEVATLHTNQIASMFTETEFDLMEYASDLKSYWKKSYGHDINYKQSCPLLADILHHMENVVHNRNYQKAVLRFGHAETLMPLQALLGLYKDEPKLRAGNREIHTKRNFRTSRITPFSSNIIFALYDCEDNSDDFLVQMIVNGESTLIPGCEDQFCPFSVFSNNYQDIVNTCNFASICAISGHEEL